MEQPQGLEDPLLLDHVCQLNKSIYGLKQAPRAWFLQLSQALMALRFIGSIVDTTSLFTLHHHDISIFVLIYVDDIIVTNNSSSSINAHITNLHCDFAVKDIRSLSYFLGIQVTRTSARLHLHQGNMLLICYIELINQPLLLVAQVQNYQ